MNKFIFKNNFQKQLENFFQEKKFFYSQTEEKFPHSVVILFSLSLFFYSLLGVFRESQIAVFWISSFWILVTLTIVVFFLIPKKHSLLINFLPFVMFISGLIFFEILLLTIKNPSFNEFVLTNFDFLFSELVRKDIAKYFSGQKINTFKNIVVAQNIFLNFIIIFIRLFFLLIFCKLNFENIKRKIQHLDKKSLQILIFFFFLIFFYTLIFLVNNFSHQLPEKNSFTFSVLDANSSENQKDLDNFYSGSSNIFFPLLSTVLVAPLWEEFIYRFLIFKILGKKRIFWAVILSIFVFAFVHLRARDFQNESFFTVFFSGKIIIYFWAGFVATGIYCNYNLNLFFPIFWHTFHNFRVFKWDLVILPLS